MDFYVGVLSHGVFDGCIDREGEDDIGQWIALTTSGTALGEVADFVVGRVTYKDVAVDTANGCVGMNKGAEGTYCLLMRRLRLLSVLLSA